MSNRTPVNISASVRQRLLNICNKKGDDPNLILIRYSLERLLYRLSLSEYRNSFVLKGAALFVVWMNEQHRPTMDLDLLGKVEDTEGKLAEIFKEICRVSAEPDGLAFDSDSIKVTEIREDQEYKGRRIRLLSYLGTARIPVQIDIGFGDIVTPEPERVNYPSLLDFSAPSLKAYPRETVVAEKLQSMIVLGIQNSRMKDFYDLYVLSTNFIFQGPILLEAIKRTFNRRKTPMPKSMPIIFTDEFAIDRDKLIQWNAFIMRSKIERKVPTFNEVMKKLKEFLMPFWYALSNSETFNKSWPKGGLWS